MYKGLIHSHPRMSFSYSIRVHPRESLLHRQVTRDYYRMTTMNENIIWIKPTRPLLFFPLDLEALFCTSTFKLKS